MKIKQMLSCECEACCPAAFELEDGKIAIMGTDITDEISNTNEFSKRTNKERIILVPRQLLDELGHNMK